MSRGDRTGRERLIGPAAPVALVAAAGLVALHLEGRGWWRGRGEPAPDGVALAYLRALVGRHPRDSGLRVRLARQELALGLPGDAEHTLEPLLDAPPHASKEGDLLALDVAMAAWRAAPEGTRERNSALSTVHRRLSLLGERSATSPELARLAILARELGRPDLAARMGERAYACAAPGEARDLGLRAVDAYLAADLGAEALRLADALATRFPSDRSVLERAEHVALAQVDADRARRFGARLVALGVVDPALLRRQLDLALRAGDLERASEVAGRLVERAPHDPGARLTGARVATWAGHHAVALRHWAWLARRSVPGSAAQALALARVTRDDAALAEVLTAHARTRALPAGTLAELAAALERLGRPERAVAALARHARRHPASRDAWEALAAIHESHRDLPAALAIRAGIARRFGPSPAASIATARLHHALGETRAALAELRRWETSADPAKVEYWELLGELAWSTGAGEVASRAYRTLWDGGRIDALGAERLILLDLEAGRTDDAIRHGREGWQRAGEPRFLLLAMDAAARAERWSEVGGLAAEAERAEQAFARFTVYWTLRARLDEKAGRPARAARRYQRALEVDPTSAAARSGMLWLLVATEDRPALARQLAAWRADAEQDPGLWRAYAGGLEALGRRREALVFLERAARADPHDAGTRARWMAALREREERSPATLVAEAGAQTFGPLLLERIATSARSELLGSDAGLRAGVTRLTGRGGTLTRAGETAELAIRVAAPVLGGRTELSASLATRDGDALPGGALVHERRLAGSVEGRLEGAFNEPAVESAALLTEGVRRRAGGALTASAGAVYGRTAADWRSWSTRGGAWLAAGGSAAAEIGVRARTDPELRVYLQGEHQRYRVAAAAPSRLSALARGERILPEEVSAAGVGASLSAWHLGPARLFTGAWLGWMSPPLRPAYRLQAAVSVAATRRTELCIAGFAANDRWNVGRGGLGMTISVAHHLHR